MLYAILCYDSEEAVGAWSKEQDDAAISRLMVVQDKLLSLGKLGPVGRLQPTKTARVVRKGHEAMVTDGPFAETKEQILGFFIVDCETMDEAVETAKELGKASSSNGAYEVRPLMVFRPGGAKFGAA